MFGKSRVLCSDCGFLGWQTVLPDGTHETDKWEVTHRTRERFQKAIFDGQQTDEDGIREHELVCHRHQWYLANVVSKPDRGLLNAATLRKARRCAYYVKYEPGYGPSEHRELKREAQNRRALVCATLGGAAIGAVAAIAAQVVYAVVTS